ncbi:hypothetical protein LS482_16295 [Sinomicrobium kalidii]|uniref:galactosyltransferase-related protein n=1 Tax=Sinomicrobium kalidii TaxID=2900738 RepID=UPI001E3B1AFD|nr:galactosyltransferase-related protein [Sinomicrobium kalidii]UGU15234.1 hypothetical protein LS482_16295 [Sinomicrobium kalidii]
MKNNIVKLKDITFFIPIKIDTVNRLENLLAVTEFLLKYFDTNINVWEYGCWNNNILSKLLPKEVTYRFVEDYDPIFHRTRYINDMIKRCNTPYISLWDTDIIVSPRQVVEAVDLLKKGEADFVTPYKDKFLDTSFIIRELYLKVRDIDVLEKNIGKMNELYNPDPVGGVFFAGTDAYVSSGMENENFYGWGREDGERVNRWRILGYKHKHVLGPLFHLSHERGENSRFHSPSQNDIKYSELLRIVSMSKEELNNEIKAWKRTQA